MPSQLWRLNKVWNFNVFISLPAGQDFFFALFLSSSDSVPDGKTLQFICKQGRDAVVCPTERFSRSLGPPGSAPFQHGTRVQWWPQTDGWPLFSLRIFLPSSVCYFIPSFLKRVSDTEGAAVMEVGQVKMQGGGAVSNSSLTLMICVQFKVREWYARLVHPPTQAHTI